MNEDNSEQRKMKKTVVNRNNLTNDKRNNLEKDTSEEEKQKGPFRTEQI